MISTQKIICGDNIAELKKLPDNYADSIVTDAPYGLGKEPDAMLVLKDWVEKGYHEIKAKGGFMGKSWDAFVPQPLFWKEVFRVLKPGGYLVCFFGTRTYDWGVMAIRLAGFEIRDCIQWIYGSGFPKSYNVANGIEGKLVNGSASWNSWQNMDGDKEDRGLGYSTINAEQGNRPTDYAASGQRTSKMTHTTAQAKQWDGWGTALKPANEPIVLARKPLIGTVVENILEYGVGGINIDGCRIASDEVISNHSRGCDSAKSKGKYGDSKEQETHQTAGQKLGRFPANVILDEEAGRVLDEQTGVLKSGYGEVGSGSGDNTTKGIYGAKQSKITSCFADSGGASRFFYCAKASQSERNKGMEADMKNTHPTVKPVSLMSYLVKLITPPNGLCIDPFNGSGATGIACKLQNVDYIGIDMDEDYCKISEARIAAWEIEKKDVQIKLEL